MKEDELAHAEAAAGSGGSWCRPPSRSPDEASSRVMTGVATYWI